VHAIRAANLYLSTADVAQFFNAAFSCFFVTLVY